MSAWYSEEDEEEQLKTPVSAAFDPETGSVVVNIDKIGYGYFDQPVRYQGKIFQPKGELHITIVSQDAEALKKHLAKAPEDQEEIDDLVLSTDWSYRKRTDLYYIAKDPDTESIIQMVDVPMLEAFLKDLSKLVGQGIVLPPTHVTLYVRGTEKGIGIPNEAVLKELVKAPVQPEDVQPADSPSQKPGADQGLA